MNRAIVTALWRQRLGSPLRLLLLAAAFLPPLGIAVLMRSPTPVLGTASFFALVLAAGAIGQDVSSGVLQLTFARPVTRAAYVTSRWFAASTGGALLFLAQLALTLVLLAARSASPDGLDMVAAALTGVTAAFVAAAVMVALSACVGGLGDVALYALAVIAIPVARQVAMMRGAPWVVTVLDEVHRTLQPAPSFAWFAGHGGPAWTELVAAASTVALGLAIAIALVNRKELSYAAD